MQLKKWIPAKISKLLQKIFMFAKKLQRMFKKKCFFTLHI